MKQITFKTLLPHLVAIAVFLLVSVIFCKPALETDVVMQQGDFTAASAMKQQSVEYKKIHGTYPLWATSMFSGMPAYQIVYDGPWSPLGYIDKLFQLFLPKPLNFFFLSCICFYFLIICLRINPYIGILGGLAFAYSTYTPIIAVAGHDTKLLALAYAPALIGSIILIFDKKYIPGFVLAALFATLHLLQNHQQITFYTIIIIAFMSLFYLINWIKVKDYKHVSKAIGLALGAALLAVLINCILLLPVMDYAKYSKRGGQLVMNNKIDKKDNVIKQDKTTGLTKEYAFQWSYGIPETWSLLFPGAMGYGFNANQRDGDQSIFPELDENSNVASYFSDKMNIPGTEASKLSSSIYWGDQPFTVGPVYLGAIICFLFIFGMFLLDGKHKWWILSACIAGIILAWGKNLPSINYFLFDHLPLYNKFRTPSMALVIPQILAPLLAVLTIDKLLTVDLSEGWEKFKKSAIAIGIVFALAAISYVGFSYSRENTQRTRAVNQIFSAPDNKTMQSQMEAVDAQYPAENDNRVYESILSFTKGNITDAKGVMSALHKDRQAFFGKDILTALLFVGLSMALIALYLKKKINATFLLIGMPLLVLIDLLPMGMHYLNDKAFDDKEKYEANEFPMTNADRMILKDNDPNFRVFNMSTGGDPFQDSKTSYLHKSIGGYHPAKLGIYDDLIAYQLSGRPNPAVLNMLNAKYYIENNPQTNAPQAFLNSGALGNCWFVKGVKFVNSPIEDMQALNSFNPADTAIIENSFQNIVTGFTPSDSLSSIKQTAFDNMDIKYESSTDAPKLAVFSEIYYKDWKAYIDGTPAPIAKANYVLRALVIPAGKHQIEFKFEPKVFYTSYNISMISAWLLCAILVWFGYNTYKKQEQLNKKP